MTHDPPKLLVLGAHPDDAEFHAGGLVSIYRRLGYPVKIVSVTDGSSGHHERTPEELRLIRAAEAAASGVLVGAEYAVWNFRDGSLLPTLEVRERIIAEVRAYRPALVLTHRTNDYHPDHRAVGQAVQDASYLVTVPPIVPSVPALRRDPVVAYMSDLFTRPCPLRPDIVLDVSDELDTIVSMLACHCSQVYEWLPYTQGLLDEVPPADEAAARRAWLREWFAIRARRRSDHFRQALVNAFGEARARQIEFCEIYEISEYAASIAEPDRQRLFPGSVRRGPMG